MPNKCEECGKEFYSDTEYSEHLMFHQLSEMLEKASESSKNLGEALSYLIGIMRVNFILTLAMTEHISIEDATAKWKDGWETVRKILNEKADG